MVRYRPVESLPNFSNLGSISPRVRIIFQAIIPSTEPIESMVFLVCNRIALISYLILRTWTLVQVCVTILDNRLSGNICDSFMYAYAYVGWSTNLWRYVYLNLSVLPRHRSRKFVPVDDKPISTQTIKLFFFFFNFMFFDHFFKSPVGYTN